MDIALDEVLHFDAVTHHPTTGAVTDADSTPTWSIFEESTDTAILAAQNFTKRTSLTGNYRGSATLSAANGFEVAKWYNVVASATVNSIAGKAVLMTFRVVPAENVAGVPIADIVYLDGSTTPVDNMGTVFATEFADAYDHEANAWRQGGGEILQRTTIATLANQQEFTLTAGSADNNAYTLCDIVIQDQTTSTQKTICSVLVYVGATKTVYLYEAPKFTIATGDIVTILSPRPYGILVNTGSGLDALGGTIDDISGRIPAALVGGRMDSSVGAMAANVLTAAATHSDFTTEIQTGLATASALSTLSSDLATVAGYVDTEVAAIKAKTDNLPANTSTELDAIDAAIATVATYVDTEVAAIKAKTDLIPADPADASDISASFSSVNSALTTIDDFLDTEIAAIKAKTDNLPASPAAVGSAMTLSTAYDLYHADIDLRIDVTNSTDEWTISWYKNGSRQTSGITVPTIQVVKRADGTDLIASTTPTQIGATGSYKHDATTTARTTAGEAVLAIVTATIDGSTRSFAKILGRDSSA